MKKIKDFKRIGSALVKDERYFSGEIAEEVFKTVFNASNSTKEKREWIFQKLKELETQRDIGESPKACVFLDDFLDLIVASWEDISRPLWNRVDEIFNAADFNDDRQLDFDEFKVVMRHLANAVDLTDRHIERLWRNIFGNGTLTSDKFSSLLRVHWTLPPSALLLDKAITALNSSKHHEVISQVRSLNQSKRDVAAALIQRAFRRNLSNRNLTIIIPKHRSARGKPSSSKTTGDAKNLSVFTPLSAEPLSSSRSAKSSRSFSKSPHNESKTARARAPSPNPPTPAKQTTPVPKAAPKKHAPADASSSKKKKKGDYSSSSPESESEPEPEVLSKPNPVDEQASDKEEPEQHPNSSMIINSIPILEMDKRVVSNSNSESESRRTDFSSPRNQSTTRSDPVAYSSTQRSEASSWADTERNQETEDGGSIDQQSQGAKEDGAKSGTAAESLEQQQDASATSPQNKKKQVPVSFTRFDKVIGWSN